MTRMNPLRLIPATVLVASAGLALAASAPAPTSSSSRRSTPPAPAPGDYENFRIIAERNIFNPNRIGRVREGGEPTSRGPQEDVFTLVGTLETEKGIVAFFDSPDSALRKAVREGQSVGGFSVKHISASTVELAGEKQSFNLNVAQRLRRIEQGEWKVSNVEPPPVAAAAPDPSSAPAAIPANASEVLRRLMEQRQKQLKQ
jgi:hypothetical protein